MKVFRLVVLSMGALIFSVMSSPGVHAQTSSNSLGVNPRRDYVINAGETVNEVLVVSNLSKTADLNIKIRIVDFEGKNQTGSPSLLLKREEPTAWSLKPYLTLPKTVKIPAGKSADVPFTITIPKSVGAGSLYSAIQYSTDGGNGDRNVSLTSSTATLMFVRVPGEAKNDLTLQKFGPFTPNADNADGLFGTFYSATKPKYLSYVLKNNGNVAEQPAGSVSLKNIFGKEVKLFENANPSKSIVLIDQTRRFDLCLNEERTDRKDAETGRNIEEVKCNDFNLQPGRYTATMALIYGDNGSSSREINAVSTFWYLPVWFLIIVALGIAALVGAVLFVLRKMKRGGARRGR